MQRASVNSRDARTEADNQDPPNEPQKEHKINQLEGHKRELTESEWSNDEMMKLQQSINIRKL